MPRLNRQNVSKLCFTFLCLLALSACQNSTSADVAEETGTITLPEPETTGTTIPDRFVGTWDKDAAGCNESKSSSFTQITVSPTEIYWFGGRGDATAVRGDGNQIEADLAYQAEGSPTGEPEPTTTTVSLDAANRLSVGFGGDLNSLIRCDEVTAPGEVSSAVEEDDKTVTVQFSPGATSATFSDTIRTFALHDYLVQAVNGQRLSATLRAEGPGVPGVIAIREDMYRGQGDFETIEPEEQGTTNDGNGYEWVGVLPADEVYRIRVAHSGSAASGGKISLYSLTIEIE